MAGRRLVGVDREPVREAERHRGARRAAARVEEPLRRRGVEVDQERLDDEYDARAVRDRPRERGLDAGAGEVAGDQIGAVCAVQHAALLRDDLGQVAGGRARARPAAFHRAGRAPVEARPQRHDGHVVVAAAQLVPDGVVQELVAEFMFWWWSLG